MTDMHKVLEDRAAAAAVPPADLADRIERGYRRRRRGRVATAAFAAVLVLAGGVWLTLHPAEKRTDLPARPVTYGPFQVPDSMASVRPADEVWPGMVREDDYRTPTDESPNAWGVLDRDHLLMFDRPQSRFFARDLRTGAQRDVAGAADFASSARPGLAALSPQWIIWRVGYRNDPTRTSIFRSPRAGGAPHLVADLHRARACTASMPLTTPSTGRRATRAG